MTRSPPGQDSFEAGKSCAVKFALRASERCFACEMRACGRLKRRFRRSTIAVSLRDRFEYLNYKNGRFSRKTCHFYVTARLSPCFVPGFHTFDFKIATAALRPRNDTKLKCFYLENKRIWSYADSFRSWSLFWACSVSDLNQRSGFRKTNQFCHCEEGAFLRPTRQSLTEREGIPERGTVRAAQ